MPDAINKFFDKAATGKLQFADLWKAVLIKLGDHVTDSVDEEGDPIDRERTRPYSYDLAFLTEDTIKISQSDLARVASYLAEHNWAKFTRRRPIKMTMTYEGLEKANEVLNEIASIGEPHEFHSSAFASEFHDWLLVNAYEWMHLSGRQMTNFRQVADQYPREISDAELDNVVSDFTFKDLVAIDTGPEPGKYWAHFNYGGEVAVQLLKDLWNKEEKIIPAANRFVRIDDNAPSYLKAISNLEKLISEMSAVRVNDWPEKEGMISSLNGTLEAIKTRYINKTAILAAVSSVTTFLALKFLDAPISELAKDTWLAVKKLF